MRAHSFFRLFPPPVFLTMPYAGLDISDEAARCVTYAGFGRDRHISSYGTDDLPEGIMDGGDIKDEKAFVSKLADFGRKHGLYRVKVSIPEEKSYLFQTDVPSMDKKDIERNIEFKLEENVPLSAQDAVFYFDLLPDQTAGDTQARLPKVSVSVVPRTYIEHYINLLKAAGLYPVAFEVVPKAIARSVVPKGIPGTKMIVHFLSKKTGIYVVSGDVVCFASTVSSVVGRGVPGSISTDELTKEISRIYAYWLSHGTGHSIDSIILVGKDAADYDDIGSHIPDAASIPTRVADVWVNTLDLDGYIPPIARKDSLEYAVAAGLALDLAFA
ncbi:MAG: hypothetical protein KGI49_03625 [Patescibacteria group bacterium]|nr:hypothetical protein [Patescibacteria group bacterium]